LKTFPELANKLDKNGLLAVDGDFILHHGGIEYKDYILHYHQLLRRGYTSNPNFDFLGRLINYYNKTKSINTLRIAIDHRRLMPKTFYTQIFELDTWYGPPFNIDKLDDPTAVGFAIVKRNKNSLFELTNKLDRTEFFWSYNKKSVKTFEAEEISDLDYSFEHYIFNKYVHSERNIKEHKTFHLDGSVKVYFQNDYENRFDSNLPKEFKCHKKIKLWRLDGEIDIKDWIDLISVFYKGNEMIIEYFNPEEFEKMFELHVRDFKKWKTQQDNIEKTT